MPRRWTLAILLLALVQPPATEAAPRKRGRAVKTVKRPAPKPAAPAKPGGFMVPKAVVLRAPTPAEIEANAVWNVRAALNVAALQCQYSPFLATTANYNATLQHHGDELARAQATMVGHFRRQVGARAASSFDQYTTRTYNSYSTLDAQYNFCTAAGLLGRQVLAATKGGLGRIALKGSADMRASLAEVPLSPALALRPIEPLLIGAIVEPTS